MAIGFYPLSSPKIIQLDRFNVSAAEIYTAFVDWSVESDNLKYGPLITAIGGVAPVAIYVTLGPDLLIRPKEASGITSITGNIATVSGASPLTQTLGTWNVQVNLERPVQAVAIEVSGGGGGGSDFTAIEKAALLGNTSMIPFVAFTPSNSDILGN